MKIRHRDSGDKVETQMSAMIDIVFQLLIFFMLTLKIIPEEGNFNISMPVSAPSQSQEDPPPVIEYKVRMLSDANGNLVDIRVGERSLGNDLPGAFERLNNDVRSWASSGTAYNDDLEVVIDADYNLHYRYLIKAMANSTSYVDGTGHKVKFLDKVRLAPPRREG